MFEVGFTEIILILGLALLVLGPEKLPALAEKIGRWTGRARSMARQLRSQLEHEVTLEELAKSKPMQAPKAEPSASGATPHAEPAPATGFDLDEHFAEVDTTPERMHGKTASEPTIAASAAGTPESDPQFPEADTLDRSPTAANAEAHDGPPEAMNGTSKNKAQSS
jgi:Tat protein translocase TatB subunit